MSSVNDHVHASKDRSATDLRDLVQADSDIEESAESTLLTNKHLEQARAAIEIASSHDGSLLGCRERMLSVGVHPEIAGKSQGLVLSDVIQCEIDDSITKTEDAAEFQLLEAELMDDKLNWEADEIDDEGQRECLPVQQVPVEKSPSPCVSEDGPQLSSISPEMEQFFLKNFSLLYSNLKQGIDSTLAANAEIKSSFNGLISEVKMIRDEQLKIGAKLTEVTARLDSLHQVTVEGQCSLQEMKQEVSICTTGFSKINSALLQLNTSNIPQGTLPSLANYQFEVNPSVAAVKEGSRTTPISYTRDKLIDLMQKVNFPGDKIPIMVTMLENRSPRSFSMLLPQLNQHTTVSDDDARALLNMSDIKDGDELKKAFHLLRSLLYKAPLNVQTSYSIPDQGTVETREPSPTTSAPSKGPATRVKRCANPFSK